MNPLPPATLAAINGGDDYPTGPVAGWLPPPPSFDPFADPFGPLAERPNVDNHPFAD